MKAGFAIADLTPRGMCDLNGFIARKQPALGLRAPVMARMVALASGRWRGVIAVCDLLGFSLADSLRLESRTAEAAGVPVKNVLLACTHTHSAPVSMPLGTVGRFRPRYVDRIATELAGAARRAAADLAPVTDARLGRGDASQFGAFRCATSEPARDRWPGKLAVLRLERRGADPLLLLHVPVHPYVFGAGNRYVHPDYPGPTCEKLERRAGVRALFLPGCGGDVTPTPGGKNSVRTMNAYAARLSARALDALRAARPIDLEPARSAVVAPRICYGFFPQGSKPGGDEFAVRALKTSDPRAARNMVEWQRGLKDGTVRGSDRFRTHVMRLGQLLLVGMPAELFWNTGEDLAAALPRAEVLTLAQTGGDTGYIPRSFAYKYLTYECSSAHQWYRTAGAVVPGTEAAVRRAAVRAARRLLK